MNATKYFSAVSNITGADRTSARLSEVLGSSASLVPVEKTRSLREYLGSLHSSPISDVKDGAQTVIGGVAGAVLWKEHRVLGAISGASVGRNVPALFGSDRKLALCNMGQTGAGVATSLVMKDSPIVGFALGWLAAGAVTYFAGWRRR